MVSVEGTAGPLANAVCTCSTSSTCPVQSSSKGVVGVRVEPLAPCYGMACAACICINSINCESKCLILVYCLHELDRKGSSESLPSMVWMWQCHS